jgi:hypothetical protein
MARAVTSVLNMSLSMRPIEKRTRDRHRKQDEEEEEARAEHFRVRKGELRKRKEIGKPWQIFFSSSCDTAFFLNLGPFF